MPNINISVKNKIATAECGSVIVCKNSDYIVKFDFDSDWDSHIVKTAKFAFDKTFIPVVFMGNECKVPKLPNTYLCLIEVEAGNIRTATPACVDCLPVLDDSYGEIEPPAPNVYEQIMQMIKDGVLTGAKIVDTVYIGVDENGGNVYKQIFDNGTENYFTAPKGLDAQIIIGEDAGTAYDGAKGAQNARNIRAIFNELTKVYEAINKNAENIGENAEDFIKLLSKKLNKSNTIANGNLVRYNSKDQTIEDSGVSKKNIDDNTEAIKKNSKEISKNALVTSQNYNDIRKIEAKVLLDSASIEQNKTDIRNLNSDLEDLNERFNVLANSDDETLDQLAEIVEYIKSNKNLIDAITTSKVSVSDIVDNLLTSSSKAPLSANQGVVLKSLIDLLEQNKVSKSGDAINGTLSIKDDDETRRVETKITHESFSAYVYDKTKPDPENALMNLILASLYLRDDALGLSVHNDAEGLEGMVGDGLAVVKEIGQTALVGKVISLLARENLIEIEDASQVKSYITKAGLLLLGELEGKLVFALINSGSIFTGEYGDASTYKRLIFSGKSGTIATEEDLEEVLQQIKNFNLSNGVGENSVQIKGGKAMGENSICLSKYEENYVTVDYNESNIGYDSQVDYIELLKSDLIYYEVNVSPTLRVDFSDGSYYEYSTGISAYYNSSGDVVIQRRYDDSYTDAPIYIDLNFDYNGSVYVTDVTLNGEAYGGWGEGKEKYEGQTISLFDLVRMQGRILTPSGEANGDYSLVAGKGTRTTETGQTAVGTYNEVDEDALLMVGNGTEERPSNALVVKKNGEVYAGKHGDKRLLFADELGDISDALDAIIAKQNAVIGGTE
jgi:hypothetical protein